MAGVQADSQLLLELNTVDNPPKLLKASADFAALAGHGFQKHYGALIGKQNLIQRVGDQIDSGLNTAAYMAARMKIIIIAGQRLHSDQVIP